jgi:predicted nucleotidyltransferase
VAHPVTVPAPILEALADLRRRLRDRFGARLVRMTLFGSYARGEAGPTSDVDVLVVVDGLAAKERGEIFELGAEVYMDTLVRLAPIALSCAEISELERRERRIALDIAREGIAV